MEIRMAKEDRPKMQLNDYVQKLHRLGKAVKNMGASIWQHSKVCSNCVVVQQMKHGASYPPTWINTSPRTVHTIAVLSTRCCLMECPCLPGLSTVTKWIIFCIQFGLRERVHVIKTCTIQKTIKTLSIPDLSKAWAHKFLPSFHLCIVIVQNWKLSN